MSFSKGRPSFGSRAYWMSTTLYTHLMCRRACLCSA